jgi:PERQ amino acid-rich with GYF domain-containing protein
LHNNKSLPNSFEQNQIIGLLPNESLSSIQQQQTVTNMDPKLGAVSFDHPDADKWFYLDPQNEIQGPFTAEQMAGWFAAGYFSLSLMIKRGCDEKFVPLGIVSNSWGRIPFTSGSQSQQIIQQAQFQQQQQQQQHFQQQQQQQQKSQQQTAHIYSKDQILHQLQLFQQLQQMQFIPQNLNMIR